MIRGLILQPNCKSMPPRANIVVFDSRGQAIPVTHSGTAHCCVGHDAGPSLTQIFDPVIAVLREKYFSVSIVHKGVSTSICFDSFGVTQALRAIAEAAESNEKQQRELTVSSMKLCKVHREGGKGCKLGGACRNVHLCRKVVLREAISRQQSLPPLVPSASGGAAKPSAPEVADVPPAVGPSPAPPQQRRALESPPPAASVVTDSAEELLLGTMPAHVQATPTPPASLDLSGTTKRLADAAPAASRTPVSNCCLERFARRWHARRSGGSAASLVASSTGSSVERVQHIVDAVFLAPRPPSPNGDDVLCDDDPSSLVATAQHHPSPPPQPAALPSYPEKSTSPVPRPPRYLRLGSSSASRERADRSSVVCLKGSVSLDSLPDGSTMEENGTAPAPTVPIVFSLIPASPPSPVARAQYKRHDRSVSCDGHCPKHDLVDRVSQEEPSSRSSGQFEGVSEIPSRSRTVPPVVRALDF